MRRACLASLLLATTAACAVDPASSTAEDDTVAACRFVATMEPGSVSDASRWRVSEDSWGNGSARVESGEGASGRALVATIEKGNGYASLELREGGPLRAGRYRLRGKVRAGRRNGSCLGSADSAWVELGMKAGSFSAADGGDSSMFSRAIVEDSARACGAFATYELSSPEVTLAAGGSLSLVAKLGSTGDGGGTEARFDDLELVCAGGACMSCDGGGAPTEPAKPVPSEGCETKGSLSVCAGEVSVAQAFSVTRASNGRQSYASPASGTTRHDLVTLDNGKLALTFLRTAMGARLYRLSFVRADGSRSEVLYQNATPRVQSNWGQGGFPVFGGVESAFPVEEHGYYGNLDWQSSVVWGQGSVSFVATTTGASVDGSAATMTITTTLRDGAREATQAIELAGRPGAENMVYTNIMIPSGDKLAGVTNDIEVLMPGVTKAQVHSRGGADSFLPGDGGEFSWPVHAGRDVSRINTTIRDWLGLFVTEDQGMQSKYGFYDHTPSRRVGLAVLAKGKPFWPKFFCGHGITADASGSGKAYCEMWLSPNARTFWDHPTLGEGGKLVHEVRLVPFETRQAFDAL